MKKNIVVIMFFLFSSLINCTVLADDESDAEEPVVISIDEARRIAVRAYPGTVTDQKTKTTRDGKISRYLFNIQNGVFPQHVVVDARTGKIVRYRIKTYDGT